MEANVKSGVRSIIEYVKEMNLQAGAYWDEVVSKFISAINAEISRNETFGKLEVEQLFVIIKNIKGFNEFEFFIFIPVSDNEESFRGMTPVDEYFSRLSRDERYKWVGSYATGQEGVYSTWMLQRFITALQQAGFTVFVYEDNNRLAVKLDIQ